MPNSLLQTLILSAFVATTALAQPTVTAVQNGASYSPLIAQGSIFVVQGTGLSSPGFVQSASLPIGVTLNDVSISFTPVSGGSAVAAYMIHTYNVGGVVQLAGLLPSSAAVGEYDVRVANGGQTSAAFRVTVVARNPGIVTADSSGSGPAQATTANYELVRFASGQLGGFGLTPVHAGEAVVLWATGLGADSASDPSGGSSGDLTQAAQIRVLVGGVEVTPFYAGRASGLAGTDQINFFVPAGVQPDCAVPVEVLAGGVRSNQVSIAVAPPGADICSSDVFSPDDLRRLTSGEGVLHANFTINSVLTEYHFPSLAGNPPYQTSAFYGGVVRFTANDIAVQGMSLRPGECRVWERTGPMSTLTFGVLSYVGLDAGPSIAVSGPGGQASATKLPGRENEYYAELGVAGAGAYTLAAPGGADIGPFNAQMSVPSFDWTNRGAVTTINRAQPLSIQWTGAAPGDVNIVGFGARLVSGDPAASFETAIFEGAMFSCIADGAAGSFTVPASITARLPTVGASAFNPASLGVFAFPESRRPQFTAPRVTGGTVPGYFGYTTGFSKLLTIQ